jgi:Domain of unknown function (DUF3291)
VGTSYQLAQINISRMLAPIDDPIMADFVANLAPINALAEGSPGFVWRFMTPAGNATAERPYDDDRIIINFSVWEDAESLRRFVFESGHVAIMRRRREWFERLTEAVTALWWVPAGHEPSVAEAVERLDHLRRHGPTPYVFTFRNMMPPPDADAASDSDAVTRSIEDACPA